MLAIAECLGSFGIGLYVEWTVEPTIIEALGPGYFGSGDFWESLLVGGWPRNKLKKGGNWVVFKINQL